jgi:hypothetical protein
MTDLYFPTYAIALIIIIVFKLIFWIIYWFFVRPRRLQRRAEQQQRQQLFIQQQQQQQQMQSQYPQVQAFNYSSVFSVPPQPFDSRTDFPPSYNSAINQNDVGQSHPK